MSNLSLDSMSNAIVAALETAFPKVKVEDYPEKPEEYNLSGQAAILVTYNSRKFDPPKFPGGANQKNNAIWQVTYVTRSLKARPKVPGIYTMLDAGRIALAKLEFAQGNLAILSEGRTKYKIGGIWYFGQYWSLPDFFEIDQEYS